MKFGRLAAVLSLLLFPTIACAQDTVYPSRTVTMIVPQAAGGANDTIGRIVAQKLAAVLGKSVVVENRPGAGGNIGTAHVAHARPDGHTLLLTANSMLVINPALYRSTGFDPVKDFEPVGTVATAGYLLVANRSFGPSSIKELIKAARAAPGTLNYASVGHGTLNHLIGEMLQKAAGIDLVHVPYKGAAAAVTDVVAGQIPLAVVSVPASLSFIQTGKLKVLGVVNGSRLAALPDVPTIGETLKGFGSTPWYGVLAPAGTPKVVVTRLGAALQQVLDAQDVKEKLAAQGCEARFGTAAQLAASIRDELPRWARIVKESGASLD